MNNLFNNKSKYYYHVRYIEKKLGVSKESVYFSKIYMTYIEAIKQIFNNDNCFIITEEQYKYFQEVKERKGEEALIKKIREVVKFGLKKNEYKLVIKRDRYKLSFPKNNKTQDPNN